MPGVLGAASIPFIGCVSLLAAMILQIISFAAPYWHSNNDIDFGLWRKAACEVGENGEDGCHRSNYIWSVHDWLDAVRGLECITIIMWSIPLVVLPVYIYVALGLYYRVTLGIMTLLTFIGVICNAAGFITYGVRIADSSGWVVGWCLILNVIACALGIIAFFVLLIATCNRPTFVPERHFISGFYVDPDKNRMYVVENMDPPKAVSVVDIGQVNPSLVDD